MLSLIRVKNYAVIDEVELEFARGFSVMTGETGAGKSILVDALGLALGDRADAAAVRSGAERAEISVQFDALGNRSVIDWLRRTRPRRRRPMHAATGHRVGGPLTRIHQRPTCDAAGPEDSRRSVDRHPRPARPPVAARGCQPARAARRARAGSKSSRSSGRRGLREPGNRRSGISPRAAARAPIAPRSSSCCASSSRELEALAPAAGEPDDPAQSSAIGSRIPIG